MNDRDLITFVCTANVCRSPMAEKLMRHALEAHNGLFKTFKVISAGVSAMEGEPASLNAIMALKSVGLDLSKHRSRYLTQDIVNRSFAIFCMTSSHMSMVNTYFNPAAPRVYLMRDFLNESSCKEILDPFGQNLHAYEDCRDSMVEAIPPLLQFLIKEHNNLNL